jgi:hypothetical protein
VTWNARLHHLPFNACSAAKSSSDSRAFDPATVHQMLHGMQPCRCRPRLSIMMSSVKARAGHQLTPDKQKPRGVLGRGFVMGRSVRGCTLWDGVGLPEIENSCEAVPNKKPDRMANTTVGLLSA